MKEKIRIQRTSELEWIESRKVARKKKCKKEEMMGKLEKIKEIIRKKKLIRN